MHRKNKRLPPVAAAFGNFLLTEGAAQIEATTHVGAQHDRHSPANATPALRKPGA